MRIYDPRLGKFLSVDPLTAKYASWSPYPFAMNCPISGVDMDGLEFYYATDGTYLGRGGQSNNTSVRLARSTTSKDALKTYFYAVDWDGKDSKSWVTVSPSNDDFLRMAGLAYGESGFSSDMIKGIPFAVVNQDRILINSGIDKYKNWSLNQTLIKARNNWTDQDYAFSNGTTNGNDAFKAFVGITSKTREAINFEKNAYGRNGNPFMKLAIEYTIKALHYRSSGYNGTDYSFGATGWHGVDIIGNKTWMKWLYIKPEHLHDSFKGWKNSIQEKDAPFISTEGFSGPAGPSIFYKPTFVNKKWGKTGGL